MPSDELIPYAGSSNNNNPALANDDEYSVNGVNHDYVASAIFPEDSRASR